MTYDEYKKKQVEIMLKGYESCNLIKIVLLVITFWICTTTTICAFTNPELTETQLFLHIPKSFILNFSK